MNYNTIGKSIPRTDGPIKTTGGALYTADLNFPGMLYAKVLRSPYAHARILSMKTDAALSKEGVIAVVTGEDVPRRIGVAVTDQLPIAKEKIRYAGEPVAVVVAISEKAAWRALKFIEVEYEILPHVIYPQEAILPDAPLIHEDFNDYKLAPYVYPEDKNIYHHFKVRKGDYVSAFSEAYKVLEGDFWSPYLHHVQLEPHCAITYYSHDNSLTMYATTQAPFVVQQCISELLDIPLHHVEVNVGYLGGGFGGKSDVTIEPLMACVAKKVPGRFIKLLLTREEMYEGTSLGRGAYCRYKLGLSKDGRIIAFEAKNYLGSGGYSDYAINVVSGLGMAATGPYAIPNVKVDAYGVYTNTPPTGAFRGYGHPEVHLAMERMMDIAARSIGMNSSEFRLKNLLIEGKINGIGQRMTKASGNIELCTKKIIDELYSCPKPDKGAHIIVGRGIACYMKTPIMPSNVQSGAILKLNGDGTINLSLGAIEMGQGTHTALGQITAEALGIPFENIHVNQVVNTSCSPYEWQTVASHTTWGAGNAIIVAAENLKQKLKEASAAMWEINANEVEIINDYIKRRDTGETISWRDIAAGYKKTDGSGVTTHLIGEGYFVSKHVTNPNIETGQGNSAADWTFGSIGVELGVDIRTGEIYLYRLLNAIDAGRIINPKLAKDQVMGAMMMAVGGAISEKVIFGEKGSIRNKNLVDYKTPGIEDIPDNIDVYFIETPEETGPYGARGIGEHGTVAVAPAILNALYDAVSIEFYQLPVTAEKIFYALHGA